MQKIRQPEATNEKLRPEIVRDRSRQLTGKTLNGPTSSTDGRRRGARRLPCFVSEAGRSDSNFFAGRFAGTAAAAGALVNL